MISSLWIEIILVVSLMVMNSVSQYTIDRIADNQEGHKGIAFVFKWNGVRIFVVIGIFLGIILTRQVAVVPFSVMFICFYLVTTLFTVINYGTNIR